MDGLSGVGPMTTLLAVIGLVLALVALGGNLSLPATELFTSAVVVDPFSTLDENDYGSWGP